MSLLELSYVVFVTECVIAIALAIYIGIIIVDEVKEVANNWKWNGWLNRARDVTKLIIMIMFYIIMVAGSLYYLSGNK